VLIKIQLVPQGTQPILYQKGLSVGAVWDSKCCSFWTAK